MLKLSDLPHGDTAAYLRSSLAVKTALAEETLSGDEMITDVRSRLTPSQMVERKLQALTATDNPVLSRLRAK